MRNPSINYVDFDDLSGAQKAEVIEWIRRTKHFAGRDSFQIARECAFRVLKNGHISRNHADRVDSKAQRKINEKFIADFTDERAEERRSALTSTTPPEKGGLDHFRTATFHLDKG